MGTWEHRAILEGNKGTRTPPWETLVYLLSRVDIVIRYIEVDFTFGLPDYVLYIEEFVISSFYSIHFTVTLAGHRISFVISSTSLNRGSLNRGSTVMGFYLLKGLLFFLNH